MVDRQQRKELLEALLAERILVLDGATGTALQARNLTAEDFGGAQLEGCNEIGRASCRERVYDDV